MSKVFKTILSLIFVLISGALLYQNFQSALPTLRARFFPCQSPIQYSLGSFDTRFNLSKQNFLKDMATAEAIWEKAIGRDLFAYKDGEVTDEVVKLNLIYDYRQEATEKIKTLGLAVSETRASYDSLKAKYNSLQSAYSEDKAEYQSKLAQFNEEQDAYEKKVNYWNKRGGAPKDVYEELNAESASLRKQLAQIQGMEADLNVEAGDINALVTVINNLAHTLNINAENINTIGQNRGEEFTEGEYKEDINGREIDIYEFSTEEKLVRVLAHELGHALGLDHVEDPNAIMYYLNQNKNGKLSADDLAALKAECRIK